MGSEKCHGQRLMFHSQTLYSLILICLITCDKSPTIFWQYSVANSFGCVMILEQVNDRNLQYLNSSMPEWLLDVHLGAKLQFNKLKLLSTASASMKASNHRRAFQLNLWTDLCSTHWSLSRQTVT